MAPAAPRRRAMRVKLDFTGVPELEHRLRQAERRAVTPQPVFDRIARDFLRITQEEFATRGSYSGKRWKKLADATVEQKKRENLDPRILVASGRLMRSLVQEGGEHLRDETPHSLTLGSKVPYGRLHQYVTHRMPQRLMLVAPKDKRRWIEMLRVYMVEGD